MAQYYEAHEVSERLENNHLCKKYRFDNGEYVIRPILPLIGDGESLFVKLSYEEDGEFFSVE